MTTAIAAWIFDWSHIFVKNESNTVNEFKEEEENMNAMESLQQFCICCGWHCYDICRQLL